MATTSAASLSSRKNVVMASVGRWTWPYTWMGFALVRESSVRCPASGGDATKARETARRGTTSARSRPSGGRDGRGRTFVDTACCAGARERCGSASTAWGARAANDELRLPRVMHGSSDTQEESGSREAAGGGLAALQQMGGATETMRGDDVFFIGATERPEWARRERVKRTVGSN